MPTATVHTIAEFVAGALRSKPDVREALPHHGNGFALVEFELTNGQSFSLSVVEDETD